jgi:hypothetical protein
MADWIVGYCVLGTTSWAAAGAARKRRGRRRETRSSMVAFRGGRT